MLQLFPSVSNLGNNLLAMASLEMGLTKLNAKSYTEAEYWLKKCQKYKNYFFKWLFISELTALYRDLKR